MESTLTKYLSDSLFARWLFTLLLFLFSISNVPAQVFNAGDVGIIYDKVEEDIIPTLYFISVEGITPNIDSNFGIEKVCLHIKHRRPSDLKIELMSPQGTSVWLSNRNGHENDYGYLNTCFVQDGFDGPTYQPNYHFKGEYSSEGRLDHFNNNQNPNGDWILIITDLESGTLGSLVSAKIQFGNHPATNKTSICNVTNGESCISSDPKKLLLPDLIVSHKLTSENILYFDKSHEQYPNQLRFAAAMANIGEGPLHIVTTDNWYCQNEIVEKDALCTDGTRPTNNVQQIIYKKTGQNKIAYDTIKSGVMYFDDSPGHNHYHVKQWANFTLLKKRWWTNKPKWWKKIAASEKVSYCLFDNKICTKEDRYCTYNDVLYSVENLDNYGLGRFTSCNSRIQGISVGGIDYYGMFYEGQFIQVPENILKGNYYLQIEVDPKNEYKESNENNNTLLIPFTIE